MVPEKDTFRIISIISIGKINNSSSTLIGNTYLFKAKHILKVSMVLVLGDETS